MSVHRRKFLRNISAGVAGLCGLGSSRSVALARSLIGKKEVAIFGGGVAGLTVAHELVDRGYRVTVYEQNDVIGGKSRSISVPESGEDGRRDLPGEHGFRFFPGFYQHLYHTMKRIPYGSNPEGVYSNLIPTSSMLFAREGGENFELPAHFPENFQELATMVRLTMGEQLGVSRSEQLFFAKRLYIFLTSCQERRDQEFDLISWWDFVGAESRSEGYKKFAAGITRSLVAMRPHIGSSRTVGTISLQMLLGSLRPDEDLDSILNGPTNDVWLVPWLEHLQSQGVNFQFGSELSELQVSDGKIVGAQIKTNSGEVVAVGADFYVAALPVNTIMDVLNPQLLEIDPALAGIANLKTEWMNGFQFFLDRQVALSRGHVLLVDSPWALTAVAQGQFWTESNLSDFGNGRVRDVLSVDLSDWNEPGMVYGKPAKDCTRDQIQEEIWQQLIGHFEGTHPIRNARIIDSFLDPAIAFDSNGKVAGNSEPLLINTVDSLRYRPEAITAVPNLFLASDYVRTVTDLASMESANEAARRAVNGVLQVSGAAEEPAALFDLKEPPAFRIGKARDRRRYRRGQGHILYPKK